MRKIRQWDALKPPFRFVHCVIGTPRAHTERLITNFRNPGPVEEGALGVNRTDTLEQYLSTPLAPYNHDHTCTESSSASKHLLSLAQHLLAAKNRFVYACMHAAAQTARTQSSLPSLPGIKQRLLLAPLSEHDVVRVIEPDPDSYHAPS